IEKPAGESHQRDTQRAQNHEVKIAFYPRHTKALKAKRALQADQEFKRERARSFLLANIAGIFSFSRIWVEQGIISDTLEHRIQHVFVSARFDRVGTD